MARVEPDEARVQAELKEYFSERPQQLYRGRVRCASANHARIAENTWAWNWLPRQCVADRDLLQPCRLSGRKGGSYEHN